MRPNTVMQIVRPFFWFLVGFHRAGRRGRCQGLTTLEFGGEDPWQNT